MKNFYSPAAIALIATSVTLSASAATPPPGAISRPPSEPGAAVQAPAVQAPSQPSAAPLTFTNSGGMTVSSADLVRELKTLQTEVDRVLPLLTAFNQQHGAAAGQGLAGILSRILGGRTNSSTGSSPGVSNVIGGLDQLLNTNATAQASLSQEALRQLHQLQTQLDPVPGILEALNGPDTSNPPAGTISGAPGAANPRFGQPGATNQNLTPTGR